MCAFTSGKRGAILSPETETQPEGWIQLPLVNIGHDEVSRFTGRVRVQCATMTYILNFVIQLWQITKC